MRKKKVTFIATKYKNQKAEVQFYTKEGKRVDNDRVEKVPTQKGVEFFVMTAK